MEPIRYTYVFDFPDGTTKHIHVDLDPITLEFIRPTASSGPPWTKLKQCQCSNCPLPDNVEFCPVAVNLSEIVDLFKDFVSFDRVTVTVHSPERTYKKETTLQKGLSSLVGIYMVLSNCPILDHLRPNVRFHLPFASALESTYRAISTYLMEQFFKGRRGESPDWELTNLPEIYKAVSCVGKGIAARLAQASTQDANVNALIILASQVLNIEDFLEDTLGEIEPLFHRPSQGLPFHDSPAILKPLQDPPARLPP